MVDESYMTATWGFGQYLVGSSIEFKLNIDTEHWLQDYVDPEVKIKEMPDNSDTVQINKFDPHGHFIAWKIPSRYSCT